MLEYPFLLVYAFHFFPFGAAAPFVVLSMYITISTVGVEGSGVNPKTSCMTYTRSDLRALRQQTHIFPNLSALVTCLWTQTSSGVNLPEKVSAGCATDESRYWEAIWNGVIGRMRAYGYRRKIKQPTGQSLSIPKGGETTVLIRSDRERTRIRTCGRKDGPFTLLRNEAQRHRTGP